MKSSHILLIAALASLLSCSDEPTIDVIGMIDGQSPNADIRFSGGNGVDMVQGSVPMIISTPDDDYKVYVGTDMHIDAYASTTHTDTFLKAFADDPEAPMALILGDLVDGSNSMQMASGRVREMAGDKSGSVFLALGNHDIFFKLWDQWTREWGASNYTIQVKTPSGTDRYICIDSASGYIGSKQLAWLKDILDTDEEFRHIIVFTHTHMFKKDMSQGHTSNYPMEETWELTSLFKRSGVELFISGHSHCRDISYFNGVQYVVVDALEEHYPDSETGYMILEAGNNLDCRFFRFDGK